MSTRTISNLKERLITIMVAPLISCSARIPVYTLLIALVVPEDHSIGIFNMQGIIMMGLYLLGFIAAQLAALVFKLIIKSKEKSSFTMEMPIYRMPRWNNVGYAIYNKVKVFLLEAGKVIIAISIIL
ncbi:MAG: ferrous iron transporter B, partial [Flavobacteriales bacterium CG_4_10_14_0_8_um_filter_32_5]